MDVEIDQSESRISSILEDITNIKTRPSVSRYQ